MTEWNLTHLFGYTSAQDQKIDLDIQAMVDACGNFAQEFSDLVDLAESDKLLAALNRYEQLVARLDQENPISYLQYLHALDTTSTEIQARLNQVITQEAQMHNKILFFGLFLGRIPPEHQTILLTDPSLAAYHYFLERQFITGRYRLDQAVEQILNLTALPRSSMWRQATEKLVGRQKATYQGQLIPLSQAQNLISEICLEDGRRLHRRVCRRLIAIADMAEAELNALLTSKKILDQERGYAQPYSAQVIGNENTETAIETLVKAVNDHLDIAHDFYRLKARLLGKRILRYADRSARIGQTSAQITFEDSQVRLEHLFASLDPRYRDILVRLRQNHQVDVFPKVGKQGSAFCASGINSPTLILLNWVDGVKAHLIYAHEMGHAIHAEMSKIQSPFYQGASLSLAETASTFFEGLAFDDIVRDLPAGEQIVALHDQIQEDIFTIFRQVACFNFELELHRLVREKGYVPKEDIAAMMNRHMAVYLGPVFKLEDLDGYAFVAWPHLRYSFYVYTYAFGKLVSTVLRRRVQEDRAYISQVNRFLTAGRSKSPEAILKDIGIVPDRQFFEEGLATIRRKVDQLGQLVK